MQVVGFAKGEWDYHPLETNTTDSPYTLVKRDVCEKNSFLMNFKHVQTFCGNGNDRLDSSGNVVNVKDLGSGLYIKKNDFYFIAGVLSKASSTDSLVVFTDVYQYLKWIK